jgi:hypothetical protein
MLSCLEGVLHCQQLLKAMSKPTDDETDAHKYLRWAAEQIAKRAFGGITENLNDVNGRFVV